MVAEDAAVILVDTSVIVAWLDANHHPHAICTAALDRSCRKYTSRQKENDSKSQKRRAVFLHFPALFA